MRKKIIAAILICVIALTTVAGFSACGKSNLKKGEMVTERGWAQAFRKTCRLDNYSYYKQSKINSIFSGKVYHHFTFYTDEYTVEQNDKDKTNSAFLCDKQGGYAYYERIENEHYKINKQQNDYEEEKSIYKDKTIDKYYYLNDMDDAFYCTSTSEGYTTTNGERKNFDLKIEPYRTGIANYINESTNKEYSYYYLNKHNSNTLGQGKLEELYGLFTYSHGVYTAKLYDKVVICLGFSDLVPCKVTVSIKDGYVTGFSVKSSITTHVSKMDAYGDYTYKQEIIHTITDIGKTDPSKKFNKDVTKTLINAKKSEID